MTLIRLFQKEIGKWNIQTCLGCNSCTNVCPVSGFEDMSPSKLIQLIINGESEIPLNTKWIWYCSQCGNCQAVCPMDIPLPSIIHILKSLQPEEMLPNEVRERIQKWRLIGNASSIYPGEYMALVKEAEVILKKKTGKALSIPVDKKKARVFLLIDPGLLKEAPDILADYALIFFRAKESWSIPSIPLGTFDPFIMTGRADLTRLWIERVYDLFKTFKFKELVLDDCQNRLSSFGVGGRLRKISNPFTVTTMPALVSRYIEMGKVEIKSQLALTVTYQEPCSRSDGLGQLDLRTLCKTISREVEDMAWPVINSACCGGSLLRAGLEGEVKGFYAAKSRELTGMKSEAIVTFCATCFLQFLRLSKKGMVSQNILFFPVALSSCLS